MLSFLAFVAAPAFAGSCDAQLGKIVSLTPETVAGAYADLVACDRAAAETNFNRYLEKATDADALVALSLTAVDKDTWKPLWSALGKVTSYEARDEVARRVGESCADRPKVVNFLEGAYFGLRDIEFAQWDDAFNACADDGLWKWMDKTIAAPPEKMFDEKFDALLGIYVKGRKGDALPTLTTAAQKAAAAGPFDAILVRMGEAVTPAMGEDPDPALQAKLADALVAVAKAIPAEKAAGVANQLVNSGFDAQAASLLPVIYPGRQSGGNFTYAAAAIEAGDCGGTKTAYVHYATVSEPGKRWSIIKDIEAPLRASKAKLGKTCTADSPWAVSYTPEPLKASSEVGDWVKGQVSDWTAKGYTVKDVKEKDIKLN